MENILALLLQARNVAHVHHWKTKSFALHLSLGELYEQLTEFTDELAEIAMGGTMDDTDQLGAINWDEPTGWNKGDPKAFITQLNSMLQELKTQLPPAPGLANKYEELQGAVSQIKYKMDNLR